MNLSSTLFRRSWHRLLLAVACGIVSGLSGAGVVALISKGVSGGGDMTALGLSFAALCVLQLATKSFSEIVLLRTTQDAVARLRIDLSTKLLATPLKALQKLGKSGLLVILTRDIDTFVGAVQLMPAALGDCIVIAVCLGYMAWISWQLFLMLSVCLVVCVIGYHFAERRPLKRLLEVRGHMDKLYEHFRNLIEGSKELKLNTGRGKIFVHEVLAPATDAFKRSYVKGMTGFTWVINAGTGLFYLAIGVLLFVIPRWLPLQAAALTSVTLIMLYLIRPINELTSIMPNLRQIGISLSKIRQLQGALVAEQSDALLEDPFPNGRPLHLELQGVIHQYPGATEDTQFMLGPVNLSIRQGEIIFVVGGNGSGKTTLAMLLLGLYEPEGGRIVLNGVPVDAANSDAYRQHFSAVFADFHLFEQLLMSEHEGLTAQATHYIKEFEMTHKVKVADGKFSTIDLSTGQRKRLALVSSYLEDRPIYLFDEWAADQDPRFKRLFYQELLPELRQRGKTVVVITHDDSYFDCADRIIKLQDGQLQQQVAAESEPPYQEPRHALHAI